MEKMEEAKPNAQAMQTESLMAGSWDLLMQKTDYCSLTSYEVHAADLVNSKGSTWKNW